MAAGTQPCQQPTDCNIFEDSSGIIKPVSYTHLAVFYLMSRGMSEEDARACIVSGFADNVSKELPLEYALEMNNLIRLEMKGSIG